MQDKSKTFRFIAQSLNLNISIIKQAYRVPMSEKIFSTPVLHRRGTVYSVDRIESAMHRLAVGLGQCYF